MLNWIFNKNFVHYNILFYFNPENCKITKGIVV